MTSSHHDIQGLSPKQVLASRKKWGANQVDSQDENEFFKALISLVTEPMVVLLMIAAAIYLMTGNYGDAIFMAVAILLVSTVSLYQNSRSRNALKKLKELTQPFCKVLREGKTQEIRLEEVVMGDFLIIEEGNSIAADGQVVHSNDFSVNESILTGESLSVYKDASSEDASVYQGTYVVSGLAIVEVTAIGNQTRLSKIGKSMESLKKEKSPLEIQINQFVKKMVVAGTLVFLIVWLINFLNSFNLLDSLLKALTLAMSILPEEIPVAFTTFMALGVWRMMKHGMLVKDMKTVETLGSATVICTDKTGTITENKMSLAKLYSWGKNTLTDPESALDEEDQALIRAGMWASEPIPFDPMETVLHHAYAKDINEDERPLYRMIHEYPLGGKPPMMTHIFENNKGNRIIAAKGAPEALLKVSRLSDSEKGEISNVIDQLAVEGYRLLGVGLAHFEGDDFPQNQQDFTFEFQGIVAFYDPPKKNIPAVFQAFYQAGISLKIVTGDNSLTTSSIARQVGFRNLDKVLTGEKLMEIDPAKIKESIQDTYIFTRMFPEAKLRLMEALKAHNGIVAMIGDGVNDGPALKSAHIGIAMGKKGTEIAKQAASLILLEDDLSKLIDAVAMGRKIYANLKKAIQYIISIHIPIILIVFIPLALGWVYPNIFSPVHIIFLELIMGPTCSIIYENEPMEHGTMSKPPRSFTSTFFNWQELGTSIIQGLVITVGLLLVYQYAAHQTIGESFTRTMVFTALISANIFLTLVNRSFEQSILYTLKYKNPLVPGIILLTSLILGLILYIPALSGIFELTQLNAFHLMSSVMAGFLSVIWYELVKWKKRRLSQKPKGIPS